jgi:fucose 4-O-acetylase-like acetyltransferase
MSQTLTGAVRPVRQTREAREAWADDLKVLLVVGVIVAHAVMAWTALESWVLEEPSVREPLLSTLRLVALVASLFGMATFFVVAGLFTPGSLERKGPGRYLADRVLRLGVPLVAYLLLMAPVVEYVDVQANAGWDRGFLAFVPYSWAHHAPGPLWFLEVLLLLSAGYVAIRVVRPSRRLGAAPLSARHLAGAAVLIGVASYVIRIGLPLGEEPHFQLANDLYLGQAPAWTVAFALGVLAAERGWLERISPRASAMMFRVAWGAVITVVVLVVVSAGFLGMDLALFFGGGTWQSLVLALLEGAIVVTMPLWLVDVFRRRVRAQGRLMREMGRAAFAAFIVHQVVLIGAVLSTRLVDWPPEVELVVASTLAVATSFALGAVLVRLPGVRRIV